MCKFISWKEIGDQILFLTSNDIYNTKRGRELQNYTCSADFVGHGAITFYYEIDPNKGVNRECTDFSSPSNFPAVIVSAIKAGRMSLGVTEQLLTPEAWVEYSKIHDVAWAKYEKVEKPALAEYEKFEKPAWAEYEKITKPTWVEYKKIYDAAWAEYEKVAEPALAKYEKTYLTTFGPCFQTP